MGRVLETTPREIPLSAYIIVSYDINDPEAYAPYVPGVIPLLQKHGAEILVADFDAQPLEGGKRSAYVVLRFESEATALAWVNDPEYAPVKKIRLESCGNTNLVLARAFTPPAA